MKKKLEATKGITLLYTIFLIALLSIILSSLSFLLVKSINLSFSAEKSQLAYYAAETGAECAFYWDHEQSAFGRFFKWRHNNNPSFDVFTGMDKRPALFGGQSWALNCFKVDQVDVVKDNFHIITSADFQDIFGVSGTGNVAWFTFTANFPDSNQCAVVEIYKTAQDPDLPTTGQYLTAVKSKGYSSCNSSGIPTSGAVERGIEKIYGEIPE